MTDDEEERAFEAAVAAYKLMPKRIAASTAIEALSHREVIPVKLDDAQDAELLKKLQAAANGCMAGLLIDPIRSGRVNEVGNLFEPLVKRACEAVGLRAEYPGGRSGYPDLLIWDDYERPSYLEIKTVGPGQEKTSFRSFYLSPSESPKVTHDARHILLAFSHEAYREENGELTCYKAGTYKIVDLARVFGAVKFEYQSNNASLYGEATIATGKLAS